MLANLLSKIELKNFFFLHMLISITDLKHDPKSLYINIYEIHALFPSEIISIKDI